MKKGFTLIELLVVISIIGILAALAMVSYSGAQKQTRDTQRKSDLAQYRNGMEEYAATNNGLYPSGSGKLINICSANLSEFISDCTVDDPLGTTSYGYEASTDQTGYILYADLETAGYWYVCSSGKSDTSATAPGIGICP